MKPKTLNKYIVLISLVSIILIFTFWATPIQGTNKYHSPRKRYELTTEIEIPEYQVYNTTDIQKYQEIIIAQAKINEKNLLTIKKNITKLLKKTDDIETKINNISLRITLIENALHIKQKDPNTLTIKN